jgi:hypothetical protein
MGWWSPASQGSRLCQVRLYKTYIWRPGISSAFRAEVKYMALAAKEEVRWSRQLTSQVSRAVV